MILKKFNLPGKPHILAVVFSSYSLWLSFKSHTNLTTWMEKLSHITSKSEFLSCLDIEIGTVHIYVANNNTVFVYNRFLIICAHT